MLMLPPSVHIYLATAPVDCRKSFDGLAALVRHVFGQDPLLCGAGEYVARCRVRRDMP